MFKVATLIGVLVFSAVLASANTRAATVYNNPYFADSNGNEATAWVQASSFSLGTATNITGGTVGIAGFGDLSAWDGSFDYWIFSDSGGPDGVLASGAATINSTTDTGTDWVAGDIWSVDFNFENAFAAQASTTYWLGIHLAADFPDPLVRDNIYWVQSTVTSGTSQSLGGTFDNWSNYTPARAFTLRDDPIAPIPLPAALPLLLSALGFFGFLGWRRRQTAAA